MNELVNFLDALAAKIPGSKQTIDLIESQPPCIRDIIKLNKSSIIKKHISSTEIYADMTQVTVY